GFHVTGVQTCALPIYRAGRSPFGKRERKTMFNTARFSCRSLVIVAIVALLGSTSTVEAQPGPGPGPGPGGRLPGPGGRAQQAQQIGRAPWREGVRRTA